MGKMMELKSGKLETELIVSMDSIDWTNAIDEHYELLLSAEQHLRQAISDINKIIEQQEEYSEKRIEDSLIWVFFLFSLKIHPPL